MALHLKHNISCESYEVLFRIAAPGVARKQSLKPSWETLISCNDVSSSERKCGCMQARAQLSVFLADSSHSGWRGPWPLMHTEIQPPRAVTIIWVFALKPYNQPPKPLSLNLVWVKLMQQAGFVYSTFHLLGLGKSHKLQNAASCHWLPLILRPLSGMAATRQKRRKEKKRGCR